MKKEKITIQCKNPKDPKEFRIPLAIDKNAKISEEVARLINIIKN